MGRRNLGILSGDYWKYNGLSGGVDFGKGCTVRKVTLEMEGVVVLAMLVMLVVVCVCEMVMMGCLCGCIEALHILRELHRL